MAKKEEITYSKALAELEEIVTLIENEDVEMDSLLEKVKRASLLLKVCRAKLKETEEGVKKILVDIGEEKDSS